MTTTLSLFILVNGQPSPFPSADEQIVLDSFSVRMQRMGSVPSITADVMYRECLDGRWEGVFTVFKGERFYVKTEPDTSKDSTDVRYRHSVTFVSERKVLDDVYMVDAVSASVSGDGYKSNDTRVVFSGNITQWAARLNAALEYCGLYDAEEDTGYRVVVDQGVSMDDVLVSFEEKYISEALQEGYKAFGIPYYFKRNENVMEIHMGDSEGSIDTLIQYGHNDALLSIERRNANIKTANRMSGYGSSDNLPYYYPNDTPIGNNPDLEVEAEEGSTVVPSIRSTQIISSHISDFPLTYSSGVHKKSDSQRFDTETICEVRPEYGKLRITGCEYDNLEIDDKVMLDHDTRIIFSFGYGNTNAYTLHDPNFPGSHIKLQQHADSMTVTEAFAINQDTGITYEINSGIEMTLPAGIYSIIVSFSMTVSTSVYYDISFDPRFEGEVYYEYNTLAWRNRDEHIVNLDELGIDSTGTPVVGDVINLVVGDYIEPIGRLMPPIYKESGGTERFYNAINHTTGQTGYPIPGTNPVQYYHFDHPYSDSDRRELIQEFSDIKPTITGVINSSIQRIDQFLEVAFDENDNDDKDADGAYLHPYFFVKLPKTDGQYGFNLFDCVSDKAMTLIMTSGVCGSCKFEIGVDDEFKKNTVQVDENGDLVRNDKGDVVCGREGQSKVQMQARQQDSENYEVWIALKKDNKTYPSIMPSYNQSLRPAAEDDTFVLVNINMPSAYIRDAEERLKIAIIEQMSVVNSEIFNPGIGFSRVFLEEHPFFLASLTENSKLTNIVYNGVRYGYYVSELTYTMSEGDILPELSVSLVSELKTQSSTFETRLEALKQNIVNTIDRGFNASYFATAEQGRRADSAIQDIKVGGNILEKEGADGNKSVSIPYADSGKFGMVSADDQTFSGNKTFDNQVIGMQGVSAKGIPDLTLVGGTGGGRGTVTKIEVNGVEHEPDADGVVELPDYPADLTEDVEALQEDVQDIQTVIPDTASGSNPLVDTESMNDAIEAVEARGLSYNAQGDAFPTKASLTNATTFYYGGSVVTPTNNDIVYVLADEGHDGGTTKYALQNGIWAFRILVNESPMSQAQLDALNSGITQTKRQGYDNPTFTEASSMDNIASGESASTLWGKVMKAISSLITHLADNVRHITAAERTAWNGKATPTDITNAINALDVTDSAQTNKFVTAVSEADGKISVSRAQPEIGNVNGLQSALDGKLAKTGLEYTSGENLVYQRFWVGSANTSVTDNGKSITISPENIDTYFGIKPSDNIQIGEEVSISLDVEYEGEDDGNWLWKWWILGTGSSGIPLSLNGNGHYAVKGNTGKVCTKDTVIMGVDDAGRTTLPINSFKIKNLKVERGGVATGFCLCPAEQRAATLTTPRTIQTNLGSTTAASFDGSANVTPGITGTLPIANGGTGATTAKAAEFNIVNPDEFNGTLTDDSQITYTRVSSASTTNGRFQRSKVSILWNYIKDKISSVLGLTATEYGGNAATATKLAAARTITIGNKSNTFDGSGNITFTLADINAKQVQTAKSDPSASGTTITVIDTISQNEQGVITATKKTIRDASASQSGVVSTGTQTFAGDKTFNGNVVGMLGVSAKGINDLTVFGSGVAGGSAEGAVRYDEAQELTEEQQAQARENIGVEFEWATDDEINAMFEDL